MLEPKRSKHFIFFLILFPLYLFPQKKSNQLKNKERHGYWIDYWDHDTSRIANAGSYRNGNPKGTWLYYTQEGKLEKKEKIFLKRLKTTFYYPSGKIRKTGKARAVFNKKEIHYYYYGKWKVYDENGELMKVQHYEKGKNIIERDYLTTATKGTNDSLLKVVRKLNERFEKCNQFLIGLEEKYKKGSAEYNDEVKKANSEANEIFSEIENIVTKFGYPGRTLVGVDYAIVFSIISSGKLAIKEKYLMTIIDAANKGELDWKDVAYYIDKVHVARKEKQEFGTQFKLDGKKVIFYPIETISDLNERRKKVELPPLDLSAIDDSASY